MQTYGHDPKMTPIIPPPFALLSACHHRRQRGELVRSSKQQASGVLPQTAGEGECHVWGGQGSQVQREPAEAPGHGAGSNEAGDTAATRGGEKDAGRSRGPQQLLLIGCRLLDILILKSFDAGGGGWGRKGREEGSVLFWMVGMERRTRERTLRCSVLT